jgi:hypothetical protein
VGTSQGARDLFDSGRLEPDTSQILVSGLPADASTIYVRLKYKVQGYWNSVDYQYTAVDMLPKISSPEPGSTLDDFSVNFVWTPELLAVEKWKLWIGSAPGLRDYFDSGGLFDTQVTCNVVPTDGSQIYVRLKYRIDGSWNSRDYQYTAVNRFPAIISPAPGSDLDQTAVEFAWQDNGAYIRKYKLWVGSSSGGRDIYNSGGLAGDVTSHTATGLPTDGSTIHVRLKYKSGISWKKVDYQYTTGAP